jgi:cytosine/uracil/thiamine/allantoin permease
MNLLSTGKRKYLYYATAIYAPSVILAVALMNVWGAPHTEQVTYTLEAVGTFLGAISGVFGLANYSPERAYVKEGTD